MTTTQGKRNAATAASTRSAEPTPPGSIRRGSFTAFRALGALTLLACVVQIMFAGLGAFGASLDAHRVLGMIIAALTVLILVLGLISRPSKPAVGLTLLLVVLATSGQYGLASLGSDQDAWFGGLHALNGLVVMGILSRLAFATGFSGVEQADPTSLDAGVRISPTVTGDNERSPGPRRRSRPSR